MAFSFDWRRGHVGPTPSKRAKINNKGRDAQLTDSRVDGADVEESAGIVPGNVRGTSYAKRCFVVLNKQHFATHDDLRIDQKVLFAP